VKEQNTQQQNPERAINTEGTLKRLIKRLARYKSTLIPVYILGIIGIILTSIAPKLIGNITTIIFGNVANRQSISFEKIIPIIQILVVLYIVSSIFTYLQSYVATKVSQNVIYNLRRDIDKKLSKLPLSYFDTKTHGEVLSNVTNDVETINTSLLQILTQIITTVVTIISVLIMMLTISPIMTLIAFITIPLSMIFIKIILKKSQVYFKGQQADLARINSHIEEMYSGNEVIQIYNKQENSINKLEVINTNWYKNAWKSQFSSGAIMPIIQFIGNLNYVAIAVGGAILSINGRISVGNIQAFIQYVRQFNQPIVQISNIFSVFQSVVAAAERIFILLDQTEEVAETTTPVKLENITGNVTFSNIHFGYTKNDELINGVSFEAKSGQTVAIVGPTGAGKTTLVNLLLRFYDITSGDILIDGVSIYDMTRSHLRSHFGMVLQDTWLYNASIMDNIRYSNSQATDEDVIMAAKSSYTHHFIETLPNGYDFVLNEDASNISTGQKQLLTITRAILANPNILILDEATSNIDTRTEVLIQKAMNKMMDNRTSFVIAHRLSTIRDADLILVLKDGNIVEQGNHTDLLLTGGYYSELYNSQFEK